MSDAFDLDSLEAFEKAATPGPWNYTESDMCGPDRYVGDIEWPEDRAFVRAIRNAAPELFKAAKERDEWERKYNAISMGADPKASGTAKAYRDAVEMACNEALGRYKHEAREAQSALAAAIARIAELLGSNQ